MEAGAAEVVFLTAVAGFFTGEDAVFLTAGCVLTAEGAEAGRFTGAVAVLEAVRGAVEAAALLLAACAAMRFF